MNSNENFNIENKFINYNNKQKKKESKIAIIIIILVLLLAIAGYLFYINKIEKESNKKTGDNYEEYDPNYKIEESNSNVTSNIESNVTSNVTSDITSNIASNINITSNIVKSNSNIVSNKNSNNNKTVAVTDIKISPTSLSIEKGKTATLSATISPSNATNKSVTWSSSNTSIATVSNGKITAKKAGTTTITAKSNNGKSAICKVTVTDNYIAVTGAHWVINDPFVLYIGSSMRMRDKVSIEPYNATNKSIKWKSSNPSAASIDSSTGIIKGLSDGNTQIAGTLSNGSTIKINVQVRNNPSNYAIEIRKVGGVTHGGIYQPYYRFFITKNGNDITNYKSFSYNGKTYTPNNLSIITNSNFFNTSIKTGIIVDEYGYTLSNVKVVYPN